MSKILHLQDGASGEFSARGLTVYDPAWQDCLMPKPGLLKPLLVDAIGRSGTTVMMKLLASSPGVLAECEYPYESRYLTYFASLSRMIDGDPRLAGKWPRDIMLQGPPDQIGGLPWRQLVADSGALADNCLLDLWGRFSAGVSAGQTHYIEKVSRWVSEHVPSVIPDTKIIHLVRDPRDVWLSMAAFNAKRGYLAFGREDNDEDEDFLLRFMAKVRQRMEPLLERELGGQEILIRYEDFMSDTDSAAMRLGNWLELDLDASVLSERITEHATSSDSGNSIKRWKRELSRAMCKRFKQDMGDLLKGFGYC